MNIHVLAKYHAKKEKLSGKRECATECCDTILSRYNEEDHCWIHLEELRVTRVHNCGGKCVRTVKTDCIG